MKRLLARFILRACGWTIEGERPAESRYVLIAAPHTSNWDFPLMILFAWSFNIHIAWMGKASLFKPPFGWIMRLLGGIPIQRSKSNNLVDAMSAAFTQQDELVVVVPTEGTRARSEYWKSGFYHIARKAGVPIIPSYLDFGQRRGGFGAAFWVSGDILVDMQYLRDFYAPMQGLHPENFGPVRLAEEEQAQPRRALG